MTTSPGRQSRAVVERAGGALFDLTALTRLGLDAVAAQGLADLVSARARRRLLRARVDVGAVFSYGAFEVRLADEAGSHDAGRDDSDRVDVLGCVTVDDGGFDALPSSSSSSLSSSLSSAIAHWRRAPRGIEALWVERDGTPGAVPFAFFRFANDAAAVDIVKAAAALSTPASTLVRLQAFASSSSSSSSSSAQLLHVAHVAARSRSKEEEEEDAAVRVHVGVVPDRVKDVVAGVVDEDVAAAAHDVAAAWPAGLLLGVQFDLHASRPSPFIDLELFLPSSPADDDRWRRPLARIAEQAAVPPARLSLVQRWPTRHREPPSLTWPLELQRTLQVKLRLTKTTTTAKAYLGFSPRMAV